ncbi:MAG: hypothetical protein ACLTQF_12925 [Lachnospira sp.]
MRLTLETDFVAKNETFQEFVQTVADTALASDLNGGANGEDIEALLATNGLSDLLVEDSNNRREVICAQIRKGNR